MNKKYILRLTDEERAICEATIKKETSKSPAGFGHWTLRMRTTSRRLPIHDRLSKGYIEAALPEDLVWTGH
jgi:hypothetical protein